MMGVDCVLRSLVRDVACLVHSVKKILRRAMDSIQCRTDLPEKGEAFSLRILGRIEGELDCVNSRPEQFIRVGF